MADLASLERTLDDFNPQRLRLLREAFPLTTQQLAESLGVAASTVSQLESGRHKPKAQTLLRLSVALGVPITFFAGAPLPELREQDCYFRKQRSAKVRERKVVLSRGSVALLLFDYLHSRVEFPVGRLPEIWPLLGPSDSAAEAAAKFRSHFRLGLGPIGTMVGLLESLGIIAVEIPGHSTTVDAFSTWHGPQPVVFLVPDKQSASRRRFDAAHELGHLVLHKHAAHGDEVLERDANSFAASLLLPEQAFVAEFPRRLDWQTLLRLKQRWGCSLALLTRRAFDLGLISEATYRRGFQQLNALDWRRTEPNEPPIERPTLLSKAMELLEANGTSRAQLAEDLKLHPDYPEKLTGSSFIAAA